MSSVGEGDAGGGGRKMDRESDGEGKRNGGERECMRGVVRMEGRQEKVIERKGKAWDGLEVKGEATGVRTA